MDDRGFSFLDLRFGHVGTCRALRNQAEGYMRTKDRIWTTVTDDVIFWSQTEPVRHSLALASISL
jgi:hypothetical protein